MIVVYPDDFTQAVLPGEVNANLCDHEAGDTHCVHDWRIAWQNMPRVSE
ncbi:hypothetical protein MycrhDRAFT_6900 [Mycolicibacterium rhodesiae JS60]|nr:hypothetical protein MycrhDRAFT_6900 [Mycolicibacterium rhodesiae JS60]